MAMNKSLGEMLRFVSMEESQALQELCEYNDISEDQLMVAENITILEMFLFNFTRICCMTFFPNLISLSLVQQNLRTIEGLHCLPHLEILRLSENEIQRIEGLSNCLKLKQIYLQNNRITRIANLSHLSGLRVLWLANNLIKWVEGLENLQIKELNIAKNPLCQLGNILKLKTLKYLNVSGTCIGSFKEISNLTRLKKLKDLRFSDPHWGPSPLALLHNYQLQTYILFRLQDLRKLDTIEITYEAKQTAKATYTRKRVYYNLCVKSLQQSKRSSSTFINESKQIKGLQRNLAQYMKISRDIDKNIMNGMDDSNKSDVELKEPSKALQKRWSESKMNSASLNQQICTLLKRLDHLNKELQVSKAREQAAIDLSIHWLIVELDSGGNIRMESGSAKDIWYKSCVELVTSRFFVDDYAPLGICGVQVNKVTRIHNRFLQDRFEKQHENQMLKPGNKSVEYLLCGETLQVHNELQSIVEGGFPSSSDRMMNSQNSSPVLLSNSVGLADCCRLKVFAEHPDMEIPSTTASGWVLVVKTCLGTSVKDVRCKYTQIPCKECCKNSSVDGDGSTIVRKSSYPHADSVYRSHPTDSKQRSWFVFDSSVVVPEYLVEFEYSFTKPIEAKSGDQALQPQSTVGVTDLLVTDLGDLFLSTYCEPISLKHMDVASLPAILESSLFGPGVAQMDVPLPCELAMELPTVEVSLSTDFILGVKKYGISDLQFMTHLNLHDSNITEIAALGELRCLKVLIICFNKISKITGLEDLLMLERLDLSYNLLTKIEGLNGLGSLTSLDLGGNQIWDPADLPLLEVPQLLSLNLRANPIVDDQDYPMMVLRAISSLIKLDDNSITPEERIEAARKYFSSPAECFSSPTFGRRNLLSSLLLIPTHDQHKDLKQENSLMLKNEEGKLSGGLQSGTDVKPLEEPSSSTNQCISKQLDEMCSMSPCQLYPTHMFLSYDMLEKARTFPSIHDEDRLENIEEVHLERHMLKTMHCFDKLSNLRRLFLSENNISSIEGLDNCSILEELLLSMNKIKEVNKIKQAQALWRLDLSHNCLLCCGKIGCFQSLEQLSIDFNKIQSLKGLDELVSLMELYAANNLLADFNELNYLRNLPKLIVVDLSGNSFCESDDYRMYTIYTLRKLKVLDGKNVETSELAVSRNKYMGRLNDDILRDCLGHCQFSQLEVLDLSGQKLRSCGSVFENPELHGVTELNLNDNMLSSIFSLRLLKNLRTLQLENNKFEDRSLFEAPSDHSSDLPFSTNSLTPLLTTMGSDGNQAQPIVIPESLLSCNDGICLPTLEILKLGGNSITSMSSLRLEFKFPRLKLLALHDNKITKVDGLAGLSSLEKLYLDHNDIKEIEECSFDQVQNLRVLCLSYNALKTLTHIDKLVSLESLEVAYNQIAPGRLGGLASIEQISGLSKLLKLSFINNPICRQNLYRMSIISRLSQLHYLDEKEITQEERQEAEVHCLGIRDSNSFLTDSAIVLDHHTSGPSISTNGFQVKIPLKVTSLNFESVCLQQSPRGSYQLTNPSKSRVTIYNHLQNFSGVKVWDVDDPKHQSGVLRRCLDRNQPLMRGKGKGENKVIMIPYSTYVKNLSPPKDWAQTVNAQNKGFAL